MRFTWRFSWILLAVLLPAFAQQKINPGSQVAWPAGCSGVYAPGSNTCVPPGTAANPATPANTLQCNGSGTFAACGGYDFSKNNIFSKEISSVAYATPNQSGGGNNGISNAFGLGNLAVLVEPSYANTENYTINTFAWPNGAWLFDQRMQALLNFHHNWYGSSGGAVISGNPGNANFFPCFTNGDSLTVGANLSLSMPCFGIQYDSHMPGFNLGPAPVGPYFGWYTHIALPIILNSNSSGIKQGINITMNSYGGGDAIGLNVNDVNRGGWLDFGGEHNKAGDFFSQELPDKYTGVVTASTSTLIKTTPCGGCVTTPAGGGTSTANVGTQQYIIDVTAGPSVVGHVTNIASGCGGSCSNVTIDGTVTASNFVGTLAGAVNVTRTQARPYAVSTPFTVNVGSGAVDTTHSLCFISQAYECVTPTSVGSAGGTQSVTANLKYPHGAGTTVEQGGAADSGLEFTAFTLPTSGLCGPQPCNGQRYLWNVLGSTDTHTLQVFASHAGTMAGLTFPLAQNDIIYDIINLSTVSNSGTTVSATFVASGSTLPSPQQYNTAPIVISGASDSAFNTTCTNVVWSSSTALTCTIAGLSGSHTATTATANLGLDNIKLWDEEMTLDVQNQASTPPNLVDGTIYVEPNPNFSGAVGHTIEQTHELSGAWQGVFASTNVQNPYAFINKPISVFAQGFGIGGGTDSPVGNAMIASQLGGGDALFAGGGGDRVPPNAFEHSGPFFNGVDLDHLALYNKALIRAFASAKQAADVNYTSFLFNIGGNAGNVALQFTPHTNVAVLTSTGAMTVGSSAGTTLLGTVSIPGTLASPTISNASLTGSNTANNLTVTGTVALPNTTVAAGSYTSANITVAADGRLTSAANGSAGSQMPLYNTSGTIQTTPHAVIGNGTMSGGTLAITLTGSAVYTNSASFRCTANDTTTAAAVQVTQGSGSSITFTGTTGDGVGFSCIGN